MIGATTLGKKKGQAKKPAIAGYDHTLHPLDRPHGAVTADVDVANPLADDTTARILVTRSLRDDPLARMHDRGQIDDAQMAAGRRLQRSYEIAEIGGATGIDPTRDYVDGGKIAEPFTDERRRAARDISRAARLVGMNGESVLRDVLARRMTMAQVAAARGYSDERSIRFYARTFRDALEALAVEYGFVSKEVPISR